MIRSGKRGRAHAALVKEADSWARAIVLQRQGLECLKCGKVKPLQAAHILSKGANPAIRYDLWNVIGLCVSCHLFWSHRDPVGFVDWINHIFPGRIASLKLAASIHRKIDLKEMICALKSIYQAEEAGTPVKHRPIKDDEIAF